ncbi:MAG: hypothetical protein JSR59_02740 [Proteobacteria bacterium]|nr:hypothetical protein [Pseudomonadota bacterium]
MSALLALRNFVAGPRPERSASRGTWTSLNAALRDALEKSAQARARRELAELADRYSVTDPELAKELRHAAGAR